MLLRIVLAAAGGGMLALPPAAAQTAPAAAPASRAVTAGACELAPVAAGEACLLQLSAAELAAISAVTGMEVECVVALAANQQRLITRRKLPPAADGEPAPLCEFALQSPLPAPAVNASPYRRPLLAVIGYDRGAEYRKLRPELSGAVERWNWCTQVAVLTRAANGGYVRLAQRCAGWAFFIELFVLDLDRDGLLDLALSLSAPSSSGGGVLLLSVLADGSLQPFAIQDCTDCTPGAVGTTYFLADGEVCSVYGYLCPLARADGAWDLQLGLLTASSPGRPLAVYGRLHYDRRARCWQLSVWP